MRSEEHTHFSLESDERSFRPFGSMGKSSWRTRHYLLPASTRLSFNLMKWRGSTCSPTRLSLPRNAERCRWHPTMPRVNGASPPTTRGQALPRANLIVSSTSFIRFGSPERRALGSALGSPSRAERGVVRNAALQPVWQDGSCREIVAFADVHLGTNPVARHQ